MLYNEALRILGLKPDYTEEELKKAHRRLSNLYHPDINSSPDAEEKMKEINAARDCLLEALKNGHSSSYSSNEPCNKNDSPHDTNINIDEYWNEKLNVIQNIVNRMNLLEKYKESYEYDVYWLEIAWQVHIFYDATNNKDKKTIDDKFNEFLNMLQKKYIEIKAEFCKKNYIDENDVVESVKYGCSLLEFYEYLLKIKEKYSKETIMKKKLEEETEKYKTYAGYDKIYELINTCINNALIKIKNNGFVYSQNDIEEMHQQISDIFKVYHYLKQKINELYSIIANIDDMKIRNEYETLKRDFECGTTFSDIEKSIKELEKMLDKYNKNIIFKKNEEKINQIYQSLITKYLDVIKKSNIVTGQSNNTSILLLLNKLNELFNKGCRDFKDLNYFNLFNEITFIDIENDNRIIESITKNLEIRKEEIGKEKINKSKVYIRPGFFNKLSFCYLGEDRNRAYIVDYSDKETSCEFFYYDEEFLSFEDSDNFMKLEDFLDKSGFIGEKRKASNGDVFTILYRVNDVCLCIKGNKFFLEHDHTPSITLSLKHYNYVEFKDKEYLIVLIKNQIEQTIKEEEEKKKGNYKRT